MTAVTLGEGGQAAVSHWDRRRAAIGLEIEKAALTLFLERGPDNVTVEEIAERAGISRRTFFRYYRSRDDLLAATPTRALLQTVRGVADRPANESLVQALLAHARDKSVADEETEIRRLSGAVMARAPLAWRRALGRLRRETDELFAAMIAHRLRLNGRDAEGADVIAAGLAAVVVHVYRVWVEGGCTGEFADNLEQGLRRFGEIGFNGE